MTARSTMGDPTPHDGPSAVLPPKGRIFPTNLSVMRVARALWPRKTDLELAARTGASQRLCRYWLSQKHTLSADALANLLRDDAGFAVLEEIMGDECPVWWKRFRRVQGIAALRRDQEAQRKRLEQLELDLE